MDYNELLKPQDFSSPKKIADWIEKAQKAISDLIIENQSLRNSANGFKKCLRESEERLEAAIQELKEVAASVDDLSDFIDEQIHPIVSYDMYTALRENADAISIWQYDSVWDIEKEEH